jgi:DDE superfamily endonuclease
MEDVIATYELPYDPQYPVVCFDEACKQLFGEVRPPQAALPGQPARQDYEYERKGVCHQLLMCEPLTGWRHVRVTERRTRRDYAECLRELVDVHFPKAQKIRLVQDNLNTHDGGGRPATRVDRSDGAGPRRPRGWWGPTTSTRSRPSTIWPRRT